MSFLILRCQHINNFIYFQKINIPPGHLTEGKKAQDKFIMTKIPLHIRLSHFRHLLQKLNLFFSYEFQPSTSINYFFLPSNVPSILVIFLSFVVVGLEIFKNLQIWVWDTKLNDHHYQEQG